MASQLYLITPPAADPERFPATLQAVLDVAAVSALLVRRGTSDAAAYADFAKHLVGIGQRAGCAVLVEDDAALAKAIGADGVHISGDAGAAEAADLAEWWAATFEIPAVLSDPGAGPAVDPRGAEFLALSDSIWSAADPAAAARAIVNSLETA